MANKWFGRVRWCDEDIAEALEQREIKATEEAVFKVRNRLESHWFTDHMIEAGWDYIFATIYTLNENGELECTSSSCTK